MDEYIRGKHCSCCPVDFNTTTLLSDYPTYFIQKYEFPHGRGLKTFLKCKRCGEMMKECVREGWVFQPHFESREFYTANGKPVKEPCHSTAKT